MRLWLLLLLFSCDFALSAGAADEALESAAETLGLPMTANEEDVRASFRELSKTLHPDATGSNPELTARYQHIREARDLLISHLKPRVWREAPGARAGYSIPLRLGNYLGPDSTQVEVRKNISDPGLYEIVAQSKKDGTLQLINFRINPATGRGYPSFSKYVIEFEGLGADPKLVREGDTLKVGFLFEGEMAGPGQALKAKEMVAFSVDMKTGALTSISGQKTVTGQGTSRWSLKNLLFKSRNENFETGFSCPTLFSAIEHK